MSLDEQLVRLASLPENWDSYGGQPVSKRALERCALMHFTPCSDGGVQVELSSPDVWAQLNITPDGDIDDVSWGPQ